MKIKTNTISRKLFLAVFLVVATAVFGFLHVNKANAENCYCVKLEASTFRVHTSVSPGPVTNNEDDCRTYCENKKLEYYFGTKSEQEVKTTYLFSSSGQKALGIEAEPDICANLSWWNLHEWFNCLLLYILKFIGVLLTVAATIFGWIMKPDNMLAVMNNDAIYATWALVRDTLNIAFILVLLFSAFATVFQVDKYSYKKILLKLVIMALLVNFSFPITRFIIDFSNVLMYQILNNLGGGSGSFAHLADQGSLAHILHPAGDAKASTWVIIADIVFTFIVAITFFIIAILFLIRTVALAILIIFSPVAFTGSIIPPTAQKASSWWDALFKYAFFGPVMVFMIYVATHMMSSINKVSSHFGPTNILTIANSQSIHPNIVASLALLTIPIVILWIGIGFAQSLSIAGAEAVTKGGKNFAKWAPNKLSKSPKALFRATGVPGGVKKAADYYGAKGAPGFLGKIPGLRGSEKTEATEAKIASLLGAKGSVEQSIKKEAQKMKEVGESPESLREQVSKKGSIPAAYRLALDGDIEGEEYASIMDKIKEIKDPRIRELIEGETRKQRIDVVIDYKIKQERAKGPTTHGDEIAVAEKELGKLKPEDWQNQDMEKFMDARSPYYVAKRDAASNVYYSYNSKNRDKVTDNMKGKDYNAGKGTIWV